MVLAYFRIGREIIEYYQPGAVRAEYGDQLLDMLSAQLRERVGRGYSTTNLRYFRAFYLAYADRSPEIRHIQSGESRGGGVSARTVTCQACALGCFVCIQLVGVRSARAESPGKVARFRGARYARVRGRRWGGKSEHGPRKSRAHSH